MNDIAARERPSHVPALRRPLTAAVALSALIVIGVILAVGDSSYVDLSRGDPGPTVSLGTGVLRLIAEWAGILCVSALVYVAFLQVRSGRERTVVENIAELSVVRVSALVWTLAGGGLVVFDAADANGVTLERVLSPGGLPYLVSAMDLPKAWILVTVAAFIIFCGAWWTRSWTTTLVLAAVAVLALISPVLVHQVLVGPGHDFGSDLATFGVPAAGIVIGVPIVLILVTARGFGLPPRTLRRARALLRGAWAVAFAVEIGLLLFKTVLLRFALTPTAGLIAVRLLVLLLVAALASALIARLLDASSPDASRAVALRHLWPLALTAAVYIGVTVAMTRIPPPQYFMPVSAMEVLFGFEMLKTPTLAILFGEWRGNILFAVVGAVAVILYLGAVIRLRRRGDAWPVGRTVAWVLGWAVIVFATSSGFGSYSGPSFSIHMMVHMGLNMFGPVLLAMGGVVTLLLRATPPAKRRDVAGPHEWLIDIIGSPIARLVFNPILVFLVFVGSYYALYLSPLFEEAMRFHWSHQLMNIHFLVSGYLFYSLIIGVDRPPRPLPHLGKLGFVLAAMPFHAFFGVIVMTSTTLIAGNFYAYMRAPWHDDLLADQHLGGGIAWAAGEIPLLIVVIALCLQWARQDDREAKRKDRHLDSGVDEDFDAYNDMLKHLADRGRLQPQQPTASAQRKDTGS